MARMKEVQGMYSAPRPHWVGNGFPVRSFFSYNDSPGKDMSPFLLLDYAGPADFGAAETARGLGMHPHRGFEAVSIVYKGEIVHRDHFGHSHLIGPDDVLWLTVGSGVIHELFHSERFTRSGGTMEMIHLWVNLAAAHKNTRARHQVLPANHIPTVLLPCSAGRARVIAGSLFATQGPAQPFSPLQVCDLRLRAGHTLELPLTPGWLTAFVVLHGAVQINGETTVRDGQMAVLSAAGSWAMAETTRDAVVLLLAGERIDEPVVGFGPFIMNTEEEINETITAFNNGEFAELAQRAAQSSS